MRGSVLRIVAAGFLAVAALKIQADEPADAAPADVAFLRALVASNEESLRSCRAKVDYRADWPHETNPRKVESSWILEWDRSDNYLWADGQYLDKSAADFVGNRPDRRTNRRLVQCDGRGLIRFARQVDEGAAGKAPVSLVLFEDTDCRDWRPNVETVDPGYFWFTTTIGLSLPLERLLGETPVTPNGSRFERSVKSDAEGVEARFTFATGETRECRWSHQYGGNLVSVIVSFAAAGPQSVAREVTDFKWARITEGLWFPESVITEAVAADGRVMRRVVITAESFERLDRRQVDGPVTIESFGTPEPGTTVRLIGKDCQGKNLVWRKDGEESLEQQLLRQAEAARKKGLGASESRDP